MTQHAVRLLLLSLPLGAGSADQVFDLRLPDQVRVLGVFFRPTDQPQPSAAAQQLLMDHLRLTQRRYREMLGGRDTFELADEKAHVVGAENDLAYYKSRTQGAAPQYADELLRHYGVNRFTCPYAFVIVVVNPEGSFPVGGGRPVNGGLNLGGGIVIMSSQVLEKLPNFQSTIEHELGHSFGLLHVNAYGYDMRTNDSVMSYNRSHHSKGLELSKTPGGLIPEDLRALALNSRVFPKLAFAPERDVPDGYTLAAFRWLGPMGIPGQPAAGVKVSSPSPPDCKSSPATIVQNQIRANRMDVTFDRRTMWVADGGDSGWTQALIEFPFEVALTRVTIHSQICGITHEAKAARIETVSGDEARTVSERPLASPDAEIRFPVTRARTWRVHFEAGDSGKVLIRGLRFFNDEDEVFPPFIPYQGAPQQDIGG